MRVGRALPVVCCIVALAACASDELRGATHLVLVEPTPDGGVLPEVVVDGAGVVHLVSMHGAAEAADVRYRWRRVGDTAWSEPVAADRRPGTGMMVGTVRGAHLAVGRRGLVHVLWNGSGSVPESSLLYARIDGRTVSPARNVMTDSVSLDGGGAIAADPDGRVSVLWHAVAKPGLRDAERAAYMTTSDDDGDQFAPARVVSPPGSGACACCGMAALALPGPTLLWMFRAATNDRGRDLYLMRQSADHASTVLLRHPWELEACPLSTSVIGRAGSAVVAAWETAGQIFHTELSDSADGPVTPQAAPGNGGRRRHPFVTRNLAGHTLLAWTDGAAWGRGGDLQWVVLEANTRRELAAGRVRAIPTWTKPTGYAKPDGTFVLMY